MPHMSPVHYKTLLRLFFNPDAYMNHICGCSFIDARDFYDCIAADENRLNAMIICKFIIVKFWPWPLLEYIKIENKKNRHLKSYIENREKKMQMSDSNARLQQQRGRI